MSHFEFAQFFLNVPRKRAPFVAEGGAFVADGRGRLMVTEPSVVADDRNPGRTRDDLERRRRTRTLMSRGVG